MRELGDLLAAKFSFRESELQELLPSGQAKLFSNRVAWAKTHLKIEHDVGVSVSALGTYKIKEVSL